MSTGFVFVYENDHSIKKVWLLKILLISLFEKLLLIVTLFVLNNSRIADQRSLILDSLCDEPRKFIDLSIPGRKVVYLPQFYVLGVEAQEECIFFPRSSRMYLVVLEVNSTVISSVFLQYIRITVIWKCPSSALLSRELHNENFHTCFCRYIFILPSGLESRKYLMTWLVLKHVQDILAGLVDYRQTEDLYTLELLLRAGKVTLQHFKCH